MSEIRVDKLINAAGTGAVELTQGATIPSGKTIVGAGDLNLTGIITATSFNGNVTGNLTGVADTATYLADAANIVTGTISDDRLPDLISSNINVISGVSTFASVNSSTFTGNLTGDVTGTASTATVANALQGTPNITVGVLTASSASFSGDVSIGGTLTYEDVQNIDSVGVVTARLGIDVTGGNISITSGGIDAPLGIVTASTFEGNLTGNVVGNVTGNVIGTLTGVAATAANLANAANITTGTINDARLPATITSDITGNAATATLATTATTAGYATTAGISTLATYTSSWEIRADELNTYYYFIGNGFDGTEQNPDIHVVRGQKYSFVHFLGQHPFEIQTIAGVALTSTSGVTGTNPLNDGTMYWDVQMDEVSELKYQCTVHPAMNGRIIVGGIANDISINTTGIITAASFSGSLAASNLTGALPAIDGSALTGIVGSGSGVVVQDNASTVGTAGTIDFGTGLDVSTISAGIVTVTTAGLPARGTLSGSTGSIGTGTTTDINITGYKSYSLLKVGISSAAWVRLYVDDTSRTNDASRPYTTDPTPGSGLIAEVRTTDSGASTFLMSPGVIGWNNDTGVGSTVYAKVTNNESGDADITVDLTAVKLEA